MIVDEPVGMVSPNGEMVRLGAYRFPLQNELTSVASCNFRVWSPNV